MNQNILERQAELPKSIQLFQFAPDRAPFSWQTWDPGNVRTGKDLLGYLILGELDADSFERSGLGWSARWQGTQPDTHFEVKYVADHDHYEVRQTWCGMDGGFGIYSSRIPLDKAIGESLYVPFPSSWETKAKEDFERRFQLTYAEQSNRSIGFCGVPDGAFRTVAFPVAVKNLRLMREWLGEVANASAAPYPISAEAKLLFQAINYIEGKAPDWTTSAPVVFNQSLAEMGTAPYGFPLKETAKDGSSAWTSRRNVYILLISLPFAALTDFLERLATPNGPIRHRSAPTLRIELQPIVMPAGYELLTQSIAVMDKGRTTRCFVQFANEDEERKVLDPEKVLLGATLVEEFLGYAESISREVTDAIEQIMNTTLRKREG